MGVSAARTVPRQELCDLHLALDRALAALEPYRDCSARRGPAGDPQPLPISLSPARPVSFDIQLEVHVGNHLVSTSNLRNLYWTLPQMLTHLASNGCNLRPGDLLGTGTVSGPEPGSEGCFLEKPSLPGQAPKFLADGDTVTLRGYARREGLPTISFGECVGTILESRISGSGPAKR